MIGKITKGGSFRGCISYVLEDKKQLSSEDILALASAGLSFQNRAEVIAYNQCFGEMPELISDFNDVRRLNDRAEKPVLHISLRLADGENLRKDQWMEAASLCSQKLGFADHQYLAVLHKDSKGQHIHIVANRVGFDGKLLSDAHDFRKISELSRQLELRFGLQKVLSPRKFLHESQRKLPRLDQRKIQLQKDIRNVLQQSEDYTSFERGMQKRGYQVIKGRGIRFVDKKKVSIKGSEVGFSLSKIERILTLKRQYVQNLENERNGKTYYPLSHLPSNSNSSISERISDSLIHSSQAIGNLISEWMRPDIDATTFGHVTESEYEKERKKKKRGRSV